jgi:hypothetical protein
LKTCKARDIEAALNKKGFFAKANTPYDLLSLCERQDYRYPHVPKVTDKKTTPLIFSQR